MHKKDADKPSMVLVAGSCLDFRKERDAIMDLIGELEWGAHYHSKCECSPDGEKVMGWDFFHIYIETDFIMELTQIHPKILKEEGNMVEQQFVLWLEKQFKKRKKNYYLKLVEIPFDRSKGFRLNPEHYRNEETLGDLR
jgi:hypothetical protein